MTHDDLLKVRWKTELCQTGEKCWCRCIVPEQPLVFENGMEMYIAADGSLPKVLAEHIVKIHNETVAQIDKH